MSSTIHKVRDDLRDYRSMGKQTNVYNIRVGRCYEKQDNTACLSNNVNRTIRLQLSVQVDRSVGMSHSTDSNI